MKVFSVALPARGLSMGRVDRVGRPPRRARSWLTSIGKQRLLGSLCALALLVAAGPAVAGPMAPDDGCLTDNECQAHYNQALKLFEEGRFESALPEFQAAYQRRQMPWLLINIGRTLHRLGRSREALEHYERYKQAETKPDPETQERLEKYIAQARVLTTDTQPTTTPIPTAEVPPAKVGAEKPLYKKWWFWTAIGGGVVAIVVIGAAAGAASSHSSGLSGDVPKVTFTF